MLGALSQLTESQGFSQKISNVACGQPVHSEIIPKLNIKVDDPLRELVLYSNNADADPEKLKFLAVSAANLATEELDNTFNKMTKNMKVLTGIFAGTEAFIKNVEDNISKKYSALEPSDNEGFGGTQYF